MPSARYEHRQQLEREAKRIRSQLADCHLNQALLAHLSAKLDKIQQALNRLENGRYGHCQQCHRLRLLPEAELCISCQQKKESINP